jgi:transposase InsO family protein
VAAETLRSWLKLYRKKGFAGLYPKPRSDKGRCRRIPAEVVDELLSVKEATPKLTVKQVIAAAKDTGRVPAEVELPPSTVHRLLHGAGLMTRAADAGTPKDRRQFSFPWAGDLMMSDVMHGPSLVRDGRRKHKTYLIAFLDDTTRVIPHAQFCWSENTQTFFPVFKQALLRRGIPLRLYVDNGANYRSRQLELVCAKLGITLVHARPYQPQGKGKIERFFRTVRMHFLNTVHAQSIDEMNRRLWAWVEGEYHQTPHRGLDGETPLDRWAQAGGRIKPVGPDMDLDDLFLWEMKRKVRSDRTVSLNGRLYEAPADLVKQNVTLRYDPGAPPARPIQVWHRGMRQDDATPLDRHANCFVKRDNTAIHPTGVDFTSFSARKRQE